ncbi:MAG: hypothetical protein EP146_02960 [Oscillibacter sp.]|uniref:hypothetical protein n=1 Tax=Oscillibacter sp. TaxID=1945593 RepID=UPI0013288BBB|nr:hypothetical protein [Oscillibacter sp.]MUU10404.1 hypothetical protein [Oscillibacter sp.]
MDIEKLRKSLLENSDPDGPCIEDDLMQAAATALSPPNDPLTLEELRKMDGEPAWWDDGEGSCWGIISVDSAGMWGGIPFLRGRWRQVNFEYNIEERKMRIYRRPPERRTVMSKNGSVPKFQRISSGRNRDCEVSPGRSRYRHAVKSNGHREDGRDGNTQQHHEE